MRRIPQNLMGVSTYDNIRKGAGIMSLMLGVGIGIAIVIADSNGRRSSRFGQRCRGSACWGYAGAS